MPCGLFIPKSWRLHSVLWALMLIEFPFTVANLALFGIASPNLYRSILRNEGARMGFNSDDKAELYAAANYRPVKTPVVWRGSTTQYHLVIGVLCMFFYLIKVTLFLMHVFYPFLALPLHLALMSLWAYGIHLQTSPDTIDPTKKQTGAPWYITKNCNIVQDGRIKGYCMQAKSSFAVSVIMLVIYAIFIVLSIYSLIPTATARAEYKQRQSEKQAEKEKWASSPYDNEMTAEEQWQHMWELQQLPRTPGTAGGMKSPGFAPVTPRTKAFQNLGGGQPNVDMSGYYQQEHGGGIERVPTITEQEYNYEGKGKGTAY